MSWFGNGFWFEISYTIIQLAARSLLESSGAGGRLFSTWQFTMHAPQPVQRSMSMTMPHFIFGSLLGAIYLPMLIGFKFDGPLPVVGKPRLALLKFIQHEQVFAYAF